IAINGFIAFALEQSAFEQQPFAIDLEQIHGTRGGPRGSEEVDAHGRNRVARGGGRQGGKVEETKHRTMNIEHRTPNARTRAARRSEFGVHCSMFRSRLPLALQKKWTINSKP